MQILAPRVDSNSMMHASRRLRGYDFDESWRSGFAAMRLRDLAQAFLQIKSM